MVVVSEMDPVTRLTGYAIVHVTPNFELKVKFVSGDKGHPLVLDVGQTFNLGQMIASYREDTMHLYGGCDVTVFPKRSSTAKVVIQWGVPGSLVSKLVFDAGELLAQISPDCIDELKLSLQNGAGQ